MRVRQRRYSKEELAQRGQTLYESSIQQQVEAGNEGKIVAIDIETGAFEVADHVLPATNQLFKRYPDAQPWVIRIGHRAVYHFGSRSLVKPPMMQGVVNRRCEATLPLVVGNANGQRQVIDAVIDTGFNGFLTLPSSIITSLDLPWNASDIVTLGDGSETLFDLYSVTVIWDGQFREIDVAESETDPLIGMSLLYKYGLRIDTVEGGIVRVEAL